MSDEKKQLIRLIEYGLLIFKALRVHTEKINELDAAHGALFRLFAEQNPGAAVNFEKYSDELKRDKASQSAKHPAAYSTGVSPNPYDATLRELEDLLARLKAS